MSARSRRRPWFRVPAVPAEGVRFGWPEAPSYPLWEQAVQLDNYVATTWVLYEMNAAWLRAFIDAARQAAGGD